MESQRVYSCLLLLSGSIVFWGLTCFCICCSSGCVWSLMGHRSVNMPHFVGRVSYRCSPGDYEQFCTSQVHISFFVGKNLGVELLNIGCMMLLRKCLVYFTPPQAEQCCSTLSTPSVMPILAIRVRAWTVSLWR